MLLNKVCDLADLIEAHFFAATQKTSQQVCFQRGDRAFGLVRRSGVVNYDGLCT